MCESFYFESFFRTGLLTMCVMSFQGHELCKKLYSSWKSDLKMGIIPSSCLLFLKEFFSSNTEVAMERSMNTCDCGGLLKQRLDMVMIQTPTFYKNQIKLRLEAKCVSIFNFLCLRLLQKLWYFFWLLMILEWKIISQSSAHEIGSLRKTYYK